MAVGYSKGMAQFVQDDRFHIIAARFLADLTRIHMGKAIFQ